ncbi:hypothetical protein CFP56_012638 [Quercus suber]|uniref:Uncharacterized protein n=1 Tax=Quercus suber TaxID=58331 RepID=A0AAW0KXH6_QUESU
MGFATLSMLKSFSSSSATVPNDDDTLTMVESECDFDADDRKTVELPQSVVDEGCIIVLEFVLIDRKELAPLQELIESIVVF